MSTFTGGRLKLKGQELKVKKKKKAVKEGEGALVAAAGEEGQGQGEGKKAGSPGAEQQQPDDLKRALHGYALDSKAGDKEDRRTPAEKRFAEHQVQRVARARMRGARTRMRSRAQQAAPPACQ